MNARERLDDLEEGSPKVIEKLEEGSTTVIKTSDWQIDIETSDAKHKRWGKTAVMLGMTALVCVMNVAVVNLISDVSSQEMALIEKGLLDASLRTIDSKVYMALIAGTVAEVSALFFIILRSMFKD